VDSSDGDRIEESKQAFGEPTSVAVLVCNLSPFASVNSENRCELRNELVGEEGMDIL